MQGGTNLYKTLTKVAVWRCEAGGDGGAGGAGEAGRAGEAGGAWR
ncbi:MAG: hypothetical protein RIB93_01685 [Coleofasciculus sp. D1-CHI-01]